MFIINFVGNELMAMLMAMQALPRSGVTYLSYRSSAIKANCYRWNIDAIYHSSRDISISGLGGRIAISGCRSFSQSLSLNTPWSKTQGAVGNEQICCSST